jgi:CBS domain containing-hemolysin-like protein
MNFVIPVAILALLLFINALFVGAEFAAVSSRRTRINQMAGSGNRFAKMLLPIVEDTQALDRYVAACQLGITASSLVLAAYGQSVLAAWLVEPLMQILEWISPLVGQVGISSDTLGQALATSIAVTTVLLLLTFLQVVLGELLPKSIAVQFPERMALATVAPVKWSVFIMRPLIWFFNGSGNLILRIMGVEIQPEHTHVHSPEEIEILVTESHEGGLLDDEERQLLRNAFRMRDLIARQVMVHRTKIVTASVENSVVEILNLALEKGHTRIPLYQESVDEIIGFVHIKDLFRLHVNNNQNLAEILREVVHVPETLPMSEVWETLNVKRQYMAIVFDEFGGTAGIITFEDLIEEIFGELQDEFDDESALISQDSEGRIYLRGDLLVTDVNEYLSLTLPDTTDTLGGLVLSELGRPPKVGDEIVIGGTSIRVESMADLGVDEVSVQSTSTDMAQQIGDWEVASHD